MDAEAFSAQSDPTRPLLFIRSAVDARCLQTFDETFGMGFFAFRQEMKADAMEARRSITGVRTTVGFSDFDAWLDDPEDEIVFPTDDDDLFHPEVATSVHLPEGADLVVWRWTGLGFHPWGEKPAVHRIDGPVLLSNNWAVRKSFLRALPRADARSFVAHHAAAQELMLRRLGVPEASAESAGLLAQFAELHDPTVAFHGGTFSLQYMHPASLFFLSITAQVTDLRKRLLDLDLTSGTPLPAELGWAAPCVARYETRLRRLHAGRAARRG